MKASRLLYGNIRAVPPGSDIVLFRMNQDKADWYITRGLGILETPDRLRLTFEPDGPGHVGDPYFLQDFKNRCVVCGTEQELSHHHIVPDCYRKHFPRVPDKFGRWMYDVLLLCVDCHGRYEKRAWELKEKIAGESGIGTCGNNQYDRARFEVIASAKTLLRHGDKIPEERRRVIEKNIRDYFKYDPDPSEYPRIWKTLGQEAKTTPLGKLIVEQYVKDVDAFAIRWREHFVSVMKPAFLPEQWTIDRRLYV